MCSADLAEFIAKNHLDLSQDGALNPRDASVSYTHLDVYKRQVLLAQGVDLNGLLQKIGVIQMLFPQLHAGGTALQGTFQDVYKRQL